MSIWHEIKKQEDVSFDGAWIDILYKSDSQGNHYITVPVEFIKKLLDEAENGV